MEGIVLRQLDISLMYWINWMQKETTPTDELALYCLSWVYEWHVKVYTSSFCWTTLRDQFKLTQEQIGELCDIHLLYMGPGKFVEVRRICAPAPYTPLLENSDTTSRATGKSPHVTPKNSVMTSKRQKHPHQSNKQGWKGTLTQTHR